MAMYETNFTEAELAKIAPNGDLIDNDDAMRMAWAYNERVYGIFESGVYAGQIARIPSAHYRDKYRDEMGAVWVSRTTIADMIGRA